MKFKLTKEERNWVLYDVANSAFVLIVATIMPIYFNDLATQAGLSSVDYLAYWGYAASIVTVIVAIIGPILGSLADTKDYKKPIFIISLLVGTISCFLLGLTQHWLLFLIVFMISKVGFSSSLVFYDAMLVDVTTPQRVDYVSSQGYAWGYIGSCIPFVFCLVLVLGSSKLGISLELAMILSFMLIALWWFVLSLPLMKTYRQKHYIENNTDTVKKSFKRIKDTFKNVKQEKQIFIFLLAFFFYIDGVYTIIDMATAYGTALGFESTGLLLALLLTQIVAFPFAILFGKLSSQYDTGKLIKVCILAYLGIALFAMMISQQWQFWVLAVLVGMFQGGIQSLSRSYFTKIIPAKKSGEYFGLMDVCGKGASFIGTTVVSVLSQWTGNISLSLGAISLFFVLGLILFKMVESCD